jgi:hypothetical protein
VEALVFAKPTISTMALPWKLATCVKRGSKGDTGEREREMWSYC